MFHDKKTKVLYILILFLLISFNKLSASSKLINYLSLNFSRSESLLTQEEAEPASLISGKISYRESPFLFVFEITRPQKQLMYLNSDGAFLVDDEKLYELAEGADFLQQTCQDFLNWFKEDLGLSDSHFTASLSWLENNKALTQWDCNNPEDQPLNKIIVESDSFGRFASLKMYMDSTILVTQTRLDKFEYKSGINYPTLITSISYENDSALTKTELKLSDISFAPQKPEAAEYTIADIDLSTKKIIREPDLTEQKAYKVSIPSVLVGGSYKFYKKFITNQDMTNCPFYPSCSQFMLEAVSKNGLAGFIQGIERLKRCTTTEHSRNLYPTLSNGKHYDPVP